MRVALLVLLSGGLLLGQNQIAVNVLEFLGPPPNPVPIQQITASPTGNAGAITYYYWVIAIYASGNMTPVGPVTVPNRAALGGGNTIRLNWPAQSMVTGYQVIRRTTAVQPSSCTACLSAVLTTPTFLDNGAGAVPNNYTASGGISSASAYMQLIRYSAAPTLMIGTMSDPIQTVAASNRFQVVASPQVPVSPGGSAYGVIKSATTSTPGWNYGLDLYQGSVPAVGTYGVADIRGGRLSTLNNEATDLWTSNAELRVAGLADSYLNRSTATAATVRGIKALVSSNFGAGTTVLIGGDFWTQSLAPAAPANQIGVRGNATTAAGTVGNDFLYGAQGISAASVGIIGLAYGVRGDLRITGTATMGLDASAAGVKGDFDDSLGLSAAAYVTAGVLGSISDRDVVGPTGAVVAQLEGGKLRTAPRSPTSAYRVVDQNVTANVNFDYGFDAFWTNGAGANTVFNVADIRGQSGDRLKNSPAGVWSVSRGSGNSTAIQLEATTFANLPAAGAGTNGYVIYCSDCAIASPCAGAGTGAIAKGLAATWVCN